MTEPSLVDNSNNPIAFQRYRELPDGMFAQNAPDLPPTPELVALNTSLLEDYGIAPDWFESEQGLAIMAGQAVNDNNSPIAMAYSGHQFGGWVPVLGDGRAHMLGQLKTHDGSLIDVQLKGSGRTDYSRGGDGYATLGAVIREFLVSEGMAGLGIATSRSLAMIGTGSQVFRERVYPGAILVRTATSHMRVGTFQYASSTLGEAGVRKLADFVIKHHYPALTDSDTPYLDLLSEVSKGQANLVAQWMLAGFVHGVMNTDNSSIVSETFDYGPCAFIDEFHPQKVFSSIDHYGRYAWNQQPSMAYWNLSRLAETLLPIIDADEDAAVESAKQRMEVFVETFRESFDTGMRDKLGLTQPTSELADFQQQTLSLLTQHKIDFTLFFDYLTEMASDASNIDTKQTMLAMFDEPDALNSWMDDWAALRAKGELDATTMRRSNPAIIARNHRVEEAINAAVDNNDLGPFQRLCQALANPYVVNEENQDLKTPPRPQERVRVTYCGT